jgi:hypothetical protein
MIESSQNYSEMKRRQTLLHAQNSVSQKNADQKARQAKSDQYFTKHA